MRVDTELWRRMEANGDIYLNKYAAGIRCATKRSMRERDHGAARWLRLGGQGTPVEWVEEESYFLPVKYQDILLSTMPTTGLHCARERLNEITSFVKGGLQDLSISRTTFTGAFRCGQ